VEVHKSARKHGVADEDILHAIDHALAFEDIGEDPDRWLVLGPDRAINMLEVVVLTTTDAEAQRLADDAERGYDVDALLGRRGKRGRPALGSAPAGVESVRLDPELRARLTERAKADGTTASEVIRQALRDYLHAA
jgi:hypothetical protein